MKWVVAVAPPQPISLLDEATPLTPLGNAIGIRFPVNFYFYCIASYISPFNPSIKLDSSIKFDVSRFSVRISLYTYPQDKPNHKVANATQPQLFGNQAGANCRYSLRRKVLSLLAFTALGVLPKAGLLPCNPLLLFRFQGAEPLVNAEAFQLATVGKTLNALI